MTAAGLDGATRGGANHDLADPIAFALRACGYGVADISDPTTAEVGAVATDVIDKFLDVAELRACENIHGNLDGVDFTLGPHTESLSQLSTKLETRIGILKEKVASEYGTGVASLSDSTKVEMGWDSSLSDASEYVE